MSQPSYQDLIAIRPPTRELLFWWQPSSRKLLILKVLSYDDRGIDLAWNLDLGWAGPHEGIEGTIRWTYQEWREAWDQGTCCQYLLSETSETISPAEELCTSCNGHRWESLRDNEISSCFRCSFTGKRSKNPTPITLQPKLKTRRSPLHPEILIT